MYCKNCGSEINDIQAICLNCGCKVGDGTTYCANCGIVLYENAEFCLDCGVAADFGTKKEEMNSNPEQSNQQTDQSAPVQQPVINIDNTNANSDVNQNINGVGSGKPINKWVSFLLCLFLGAFGAHKFYEGKTGMGIIYIFTAGLFYIGWIIDCISILFKPNPYYV